MSIDLKKQFEQKAEQILYGKKCFDIENNTDSLKLIYHNIVWLEMNKLNSSLKKLTKEDSGKDVPFFTDIEGLDSFFEKTKEELEAITNEGLDKRKKTLEEEVKENEGLEKEITISMIDGINSEVRKKFAVDFVPGLNNYGTIPNEEEKTRLIGLVRITSNTIQRRIEKNTMTRLINLQNMLRESSEKSDDLFKVVESTIVNIDEAEPRKKTLKRAA